MLCVSEFFYSPHHRRSPLNYAARRCPDSLIPRLSICSALGVHAEQIFFYCLDFAVEYSPLSLFVIPNTIRVSPAHILSPRSTIYRRSRSTIYSRLSGNLIPSFCSLVYRGAVAQRLRGSSRLSVFTFQFSVFTFSPPLSLSIIPNSIRVSLCSRHLSSSRR